MIARRAALDPALGGSLAAHVLGAGIIPPGAVIAGYWPMRGEIDIRPLLDALWARGHALCLPETMPPGEALRFRGFTPGTKMVRGRYDTAHPKGPPCVPGLLLIPLLAFDLQGRRLGYGGGYYDRTLARYPAALRVGCAFAAQQIAQVPHSLTDLPLHAVATETALHRIVPG